MCALSTCSYTSLNGGRIQSPRGLLIPRVAPLHRREGDVRVVLLRDLRGRRAEAVLVVVVLGEERLLVEPAHFFSFFMSFSPKMYDFYYFGVKEVMTIP